MNTVDDSELELDVEPDDEATAWDRPTPRPVTLGERMTYIEASLSADRRLHQANHRSLLQAHHAAASSTAALADQVRVAIAELRSENAAHHAEQRATVRDLTTTVWKLGVAVALLAGGTAAGVDVVKAWAGW